MFLVPLLKETKGKQPAATNPVALATQRIYKVWFKIVHFTIGR